MHHQNSKRLQYGTHFTWFHLYLYVYNSFLRGYLEKKTRKHNAWIHDSKYAKGIRYHNEVKEIHELFLSTLLFNSSILWPLCTRSCQCDVTATWLSGIGGNDHALVHRARRPLYKWSIVHEKETGEFYWLGAVIIVLPLKCINLWL